MKRIPRRIFVAGLGPQEEFKREAIKLVNEQGFSISEACKKLDTRWPKAIATKSLRTWMKQDQSGELKSSLGAKLETRLRLYTENCAIAENPVMNRNPSRKFSSQTNLSAYAH